MLGETVKETDIIHFWLPVCLGSLGEQFLEDNVKGIRRASQKHLHPAAPGKQTHESWTSEFPTNSGSHRQQAALSP